MSHPFGNLISQYLSRKRGLSQNKLADGIDQDPAVISRMGKGERLSGPQARERVVSMVGWFCNQGVLTSVAEANTFLEAAGLARLNANCRAEAQLLGQLSDERAALPRSNAPPPERVEGPPAPQKILAMARWWGWTTNIVTVAIVMGGLLTWWSRPEQMDQLRHGELLAATVISVKPPVDVRRKGADRLVPAAFGLDLVEGDVVNTYVRATATIICENGLLFYLPEQNNLTIDCRNTGDRRLVGRLDPAFSRQLLSDLNEPRPALDPTETRVSRAEQEQIPRLFGPRNTIVTDTQPTFQWQPLAGASGYRLSVNLANGQSWSAETTATSLSYPASAPPLTPGTINVVFLTTLGGDPVVETALLRVLDEASLADLTRAEAAIRALGLNQTAQAYLLAQLYQQREMWDAAIIQLEQLSPHLSASAALWQHLGDLYFEVDLYARAEEIYQAALTVAKDNADPDAQATAYFGLARTAYAFNEIGQALDYLITAEQLYRQAGQTEQAESIAAEREKLEQ